MIDEILRLIRETAIRHTMIYTDITQCHTIRFNINDTIHWSYFILSYDIKCMTWHTTLGYSLIYIHYVVRLYHPQEKREDTIFLVYR